MMSHYFIALGSLPQRLPQQKAAGAKKKALLLGPIQPSPGASIVGSTATGNVYYAYIDRRAHHEDD